VFRNTRMPVATIFENLEAGANIDDILAWYDGLGRDQVKAVIEAKFVAAHTDRSTIVAKYLLILRQHAANELTGRLRPAKSDETTPAGVFRPWSPCIAITPRHTAR
jgi:uncharacterized protein (DUF433 family)